MSIGEQLVRRRSLRQCQSQKRRFAISIAALALLGCSAPAAESLLTPAAIRDIEAKLVMPRGAGPLATYDRYYALDSQDGRPVIRGHFKAMDGGRIGAVHIVTADQHPWVLDGGCGFITAEFDAATRRLIGIACNGIGLGPRLTPDGEVTNAANQAELLADFFLGETGRAPWEPIMLRRQAKIRALYLAQARVLTGSADNRDKELGHAVEAWVLAMPPPDSQRLALARDLRARAASQSRVPQGTHRVAAATAERQPTAH